jgi:hypothetical protein
MAVQVTAWYRCPSGSGPLADLWNGTTWTAQPLP